MVTNGNASGSTHTTPPHAFRLVALALILASIVFLLALFIFRKQFNEATLVITALSTLFSLFGTVVGAYFGIKLSSDTIDKTRSEKETANNRINAANEQRAQALAALTPDQAREIGVLDR